MSLKYTKHTKHYNPIPKKCKQCKKAIFTKEGEEIYYQCSLFGSFKKECDIVLVKRNLPKPQDINNSNNKLGEL